MKITVPIGTVIFYRCFKLLAGAPRRFKQRMGRAIGCPQRRKESVHRGVPLSVAYLPALQGKGDRIQTGVDGQQKALFRILGPSPCQFFHSVDVPQQHFQALSPALKGEGDCTKSQVFHLSSLIILSA